MTAKSAEERPPGGPGDNGGSLAELLRQFRLPVFDFIYRMVQNQELAEQLAQEVFVRAWRASRVSDTQDAQRTWLFRLAWRRTLAATGDRGAEWSAISPDWANPAAEAPALDSMPGAARLAAIRSAVHALPPRQRAAVILHRYHGMDFPQLAQVLDCSQSAVPRLLFCAYENLRSTVANREGNMPFLRAIAVGQAFPGRTI